MVLQENLGIFNRIFGPNEDKWNHAIILHLTSLVVTFDLDPHDPWLVYNLLDDTPILAYYLACKKNIESVRKLEYYYNIFFT